MAGHLKSCLREHARRTGQPSPSANLHAEVLGPAAQDDAGLKGMLFVCWGRQIRSSDAHNVMAGADSTHSFTERQDALAPDEASLMQYLANATSLYEHDLEEAPTAVAGTCGWFSKHPVFEAWKRADPSGVLLVTAGPGSGKTVLANYMIRRLRDEADTADALPALLGYFFFSLENDKQASATSAVSALLHQVFLLQPRLITHATRKWLAGGPKSLSDFWTLWGILISASEDHLSQGFTFVVDGLDECDELSRKSLIQALLDMNSRRQARLKFIITSRPYGAIEEQLQGPLVTKFRLEQAVADISHDLRAVIRYKTDRLVQSGKIHEDQQVSLEKMLLNKADGTFLWVSLILAEFESSRGFHRRNNQYLELLQRPPSSVETVYERILSRSADQGMARKILGILVGATRPLTVLELNVAMSLEPRHRTIEELRADMFPERGFEQAILDSCGLLVKFEGRLRHRKVKLVHHTAREFLVRPQSPTVFGGVAIWPLLVWIACLLRWVFEFHLGKATGRWKGSLDTVESNRSMAELCVMYLMLEGFRPFPRTKDLHRRLVDRYTNEYPFLDYSAKNWPRHLREARVGPRSPLSDSTLQFCEASQGRSLMWLWMYWADGSLPWSFPERTPSKLTIAAYLGLEHAARRLLREGSDPNWKDENGRTPLFAAVANGNADVVRLLLKLTADLDAPDALGRVVLHWATILGHEDVVRLLLSNGASANRRTSSGLTALSWAASTGHEGIARLLLAHGADVGQRNTSGWTALHWATMSEKRSTVRLIAQALKSADSADIDHKASDGRTALHLAARNGILSAANELLDRHADINATDLEHETALHHAVYGRNMELAKLLLTRGIEVDGQNTRGLVALDLATTNRDEPMVRLLLDSGASVESRDEEGRTVLHRAALVAHEPIVRLLLENDADPDVQDNTGLSVLHVATSHAKEAYEISRLLLTAGATSIDAGDSTGKTALYNAAARGHTRSVNLLLDHGADPRKVCVSGWSPFDVAAMNGHVGILGCVLSRSNGRSFDINKRDLGGRTALQNGAWNGHTAVVKFLLENGADSNTRDNQGRCPMHRAAWSGHESIVQLLLQHQADVEMRDRDGRTALHRAAKRGHIGIAKLLLAHSANAAAVDGKWKRPVDFATGSEMRELLLAGRE